MIYLYKMECITNMHVGSGDANYAIVDNQVQKDVVLNHVPVIHASGVKGALRAHSEGRLPAETLQYIFGKQAGKEDAQKEGQKVERGDTTSGAYRFFDAKLIARPLRVSVSDGNEAYLLCTDTATLADFSHTLAAFGFGNKFAIKCPEIAGMQFKTTQEGIKAVEGNPASYAPQMKDELSGLESFLGASYGVTDTMKHYDLPVMARNVLDENGISNNLWYEEVVPHKSVFCFVIMTPHGEEMKLTTLDGAVVQFGGNASIGQGYAKVIQIEALKDHVKGEGGTHE